MKISFFKAAVMVVVSSCVSKMFYSPKGTGAFMWGRERCLERQSWGRTQKSGGGVPGRKSPGSALWDFTGEKGKEQKRWR